MRPKALTVEELDPQLVASEREILTEAARKEGKPENIIEQDGRGPHAQLLRRVGSLRAAVREGRKADGWSSTPRPAARNSCDLSIGNCNRQQESGVATPAAESPVPHFKRIVMKLSGESFTCAGERGISMDEVVQIAEQIHSAQQLGCQLAVVIGGGNILRGAQFKSSSASIHEATAHYMGMLATVINGLALQDALEILGCDTRLMTAIRMDGVAEPYIRRRAQRHLEKGRIIILAAGTGSPFVTTDTAAAQRALELEADVVFKATRVDGVFSDDPGTESPRRALPRTGLQHGAGTEPPGDGPHGHHPVHGTRNAHARVQLQEERKHRTSRAGGGGGHADFQRQATAVRRIGRRKDVTKVPTVQPDPRTDPIDLMRMTTPEEILLDAEDRMEKAVDVLKRACRESAPAGPTPGWSTRCASKSTARPPPSSRSPPSEHPNRPRSSSAPTIPARSRTSRRRSWPATWA